MSTIRTVEELRAMPLEALILASDGGVYRKSPMWERHGHAVWEGFESTDHDDDVRLNAEQVPLPAETLHPRTVGKAEVDAGARVAFVGSSELAAEAWDAYPEDHPVKRYERMRFVVALAALGIEVVDGD